MRTNRRTGTTLIEILVVIVVFLVGILAIVQVFPPGLNVLRTTRNNTIASQLGVAEMARIQGQAGQIAEMIVPVSYQWTGSGVRVTIDTNRLTNELMAAKDPDPQPGRLRWRPATGQYEIFTNGQFIGPWAHVSGSNLFNRVIGESKPVPGPRRIPGLPVGQDFGGVFNLTFAPAYYFPTPAGIGEDGVVQAYGNDMARRYGDRNYNFPNPNGRFREGEFFYVAAEDTDANNFTNEDQVWIAPNKLRKYRIAFSFAYNNSGRTDQYDVIVQANLDPVTPPSYARIVGNYWVISLPQLVSLPDIYGNPSQFTQANYRYAEPDSVRIQRLFQEIPATQAFDLNDPFQYKVIGTGVDGATGQGVCMGTLLFNPSGFGFRVRSNAGPNEVLLARVDYTVFDWRLIKDDFRVPTPELVAGNLLPKEVKLALNGLKAINSLGPDNRPFLGLGLKTPVLGTLTTKQTDDVVMQDLDTGGVILGNQQNDPNLPGYPQYPLSAWSVDKSAGHVTFHDVDQNPNNGLSAWMCFPTGDPNNPWTPRQLVNDVANRSVRVIYMGKSEWSVQPFKAARTYRVSGFIGANGMGPGECFVGGTLDSGGNAVGQPHRLYFAPYERGQKVLVGEIWKSINGNPPDALYDQEFQIVGIERVNGRDLAFAELWDKAPGALFDWSQGYAARRVRGASLKVRVMWNPASFYLEQNDDVKNYSELELWMRNWRRTENESLQVGGRN